MKPGLNTLTSKLPFPQNSEQKFHDRKGMQHQNIHLQDIFITL